jgi:hypothetical protein
MQAFGEKTGKKLEEKVAEELKKAEEAEELHKPLFFVVPLQVDLPKSDYYVQEEAHKAVNSYGGYRNTHELENFLGAMNFQSADYPQGLYGTFNKLSYAINIADHTKADLEQREITKVHEYALHLVMGLPDGYAAIALEQAMCWKSKKKELVHGGWR